MQTKQESAKEEKSKEVCKEEPRNSPPVVPLPEKVEEVKKPVPISKDKMCLMCKKREAKGGYYCTICITMI